MTETLLMLYAMFAAAGTFALLSLLGAAELHARRRRCRDAALRAKYLRIVMLYLLAGEGPAPRFPMIRRAGARLLLVETVAGLAGVTYGLDAAPLRRIVAEYGLDAWLLRRTARSRGYRRARCLLLLSRLPVGAAAAEFAALTARYRMIRVEWVCSGELEVSGVRALGRSRRRCFRRLVLVDRARDSEAGDFDAAASVATYDYLLPVRAGCFLLPGSVERLVAELGEGRPGSLDLIRSPLGEPAALLSREAVVAAGGFGMRPLRGIPRCRRRMLWEPLLAAPRSGVRMPGRLRGLAAASLAAAFAAAAAAGWWTSAAALATLALVWAGRECAARLAGGTAFSAPGGLTAWRRLFGHY